MHARYSRNGRPGLDYTTEDTARIEYGFENTYGTMTLSRIMPPYTERVRFLGTKGTIEVEGGELTIYDVNGAVSSQQAFEINKRDLTLQQIEYFCDVLDGKKENIETGEYNLQHMQFIDQCYRTN